MNEERDLLVRIAGLPVIALKEAISRAGGVVIAGPMPIAEEMEWIVIGLFSALEDPRHPPRPEVEECA